MIKKYFAMTIIAASVSLAACSDDDDDDMPNPGTEQPEPGTDVPPVVGGDGTAYDLISGSPAHTTLLSLINGAGLEATLDSADPTALFTIFAPDDAAFQAYNDAVAAGLATTDDDTDDLTALTDFTPNQVSRILLNHVVSGSVETLEDGAVLSTLAAADDTVDPPLVAQTLTVSIGTDGVTSVTTVGGEPVAVDATLVGTQEGDDVVEQDIVHSVGSILAPSDLPAAEAPAETPTEGEGEGTETPPATGGTGDVALAGASSEIFRTVLNDNFAGNIDSAAWTIFVPSDAVLGDANVTELTVDQLRTHISTDGAVTPDELAVLTTIKSSDNVNHVVAVDGDGNTTVGGNVVSLIGTGDGGAQIYSIAGILTGS